MTEDGVKGALETVFSSHGWVLSRDTTDPRVLQFILVAENEVAVVFAAESTGDRLITDAYRLGATIGAIMQGVPGQKIWEAYLLLVTPLIGPEHEEVVAQVQRDLAFCRKIVIETSQVVDSPDPVAALERHVSFLFPLAIPEESDVPAVRDLLETQLVISGNPSELVRGLLEGMVDPQFDALSYLATELRTQK